MYQDIPSRRRHLVLCIFLSVLLPIIAMPANYALPPADPAFSDGGFTLGTGGTLMVSNTGTITNNFSNIYNSGIIRNNAACGNSGVEVVRKGADLSDLFGRGARHLFLADDPYSQTVLDSIKQFREGNDSILCLGFIV